MTTMIIMLVRIFFLYVVCFHCSEARGQSWEVNGSLLFGITVTYGNQNVLINTSVKGFGVIGYGDAAIEGGATVYINQILKRHTIKVKGSGAGYEVFALGGFGANTNLLGASLFKENTNLIFDKQGVGGFKGIGFGFQKEILPGNLKNYSPRRGSILLRLSEAAHSFQLAFVNDFKFGKLINGQATDYAATGSLRITYTKMTSFDSAYTAGVGIDLFTPKPDYSKTPNNPINSDDGRKNVWYVLPSYDHLYYANVYAVGGYVDRFYALRGELGINSKKLGAYIQNTLHDSFGLNPRFPWPVQEKDKIFYELSVFAGQDLN